jgi:hypothetical protein
MLSTTEYEAFKFREDNRDGINKGHVDFLKESIRASNMLKHHPIKVTRDLQIINGQHRLLAAKELGVPIYYEYVDEPNAEQMAIENMNKQWSPNDYLNLYVRNGYAEYVKLAQFMRDSKIPLKFALSILRKETKNAMTDFKMGRFVFDEYEHAQSIPHIWKTVELLQAHGMKGAHLRTVRFWQALLILFIHEKFEAKKWFNHVSSHAHRFVVKGRMQDYLSLIEQIYNYKCPLTHWVRLTDNVGLDP